MEFQPGPQPIIYVVQMPREGSNVRGSYATRATITMGVLNIISGIIVLIAGTTGCLFDNWMFGESVGIVSSVFFFVTGGLTIGGACTGKKCLVAATLVMTILSSIMACSLLIISGFLLSRTVIGSEDFITNTVELALGGILLIVSITSASLTCSPLCCPPTPSNTQDLAYFSSIKGDFAHLNQLRNLPASFSSPSQVVLAIIFLN